jgi:hypothetical protein
LEVHKYRHCNKINSALAVLGNCLYTCVLHPQAPHVVVWDVEKLGMGAGNEAV